MKLRGAWRRNRARFRILFPSCQTRLQAVSYFSFKTRYNVSTRNEGTRGRAVETRETRTEPDLRKNSPRSNLSSFFATNLHNLTFLPAARGSEKGGTTARGPCETNRQLCRLLFWQTNCIMLSRLASSLEPTSCCCCFFFFFFFFGFR